MWIYLANRNFRSATDERMSVVFLVVVFMCAKPISGADEDIKSLVLEGHFRIKCEEKVSFMSNVRIWDLLSTTAHNLARIKLFLIRLLSYLFFLIWNSDNAIIWIFIFACAVSFREVWWTITVECKYLKVIISFTGPGRLIFMPHNWSWSC